MLPELSVARIIMGNALRAKSAGMFPFIWLVTITAWLDIIRRMNHSGTWDNRPESSMDIPLAAAMPSAGARYGHASGHREGVISAVNDISSDMGNSDIHSS